MTNAIIRQLHVCFSRLMNCSSSPFTHHDRSLQNMPDEYSVPSPPSSPSATSSALAFKNVYNSLYDPAAASSSHSSSNTQAPSNSATFTTTTATAAATAAASDSDDSTATTDPDSDPDISSAIASRRLLPPSSPGRTNAIADSSAFTFGIGVAVPTDSQDPYGDFRRSMEEMTAAMGLLGPQGCRRGRRRERLYELLLCYLALNRRHAHKYIVDAFADLLAGIDEDAQEEEEEEEEKEEKRGR